jgi:hypothetical protein
MKWIPINHIMMLDFKFEVYFSGILKKAIMNSFEVPFALGEKLHNTYLSCQLKNK